MSDEISVLIVDDSRIFRSLVQKSLEKEGSFVISGSVRNGVKALESIRENRPDVVTLDVEMPEMGGLETLERIQQLNREAEKKIGVIMLSSYTRRGADITIKALERGAFDFISKPEGSNAAESIELLRESLSSKIGLFIARKKLAEVSGKQEAPVPRAVCRKTTSVGTLEALVLGCSTGGPKALCRMLPSLCSVTDLPILIVQHMPPTFTGSLANTLDSKCSHTVVEAQQNMKVQKKTVYIAPGDYHMGVTRAGAAAKITLNQDAPENGCRPSVDVLFRDAAKRYKEKVLAIILTGMGMDGTAGAKVLKEHNVFVIAQDEPSSVVWGMPGSAVKAGVVDSIKPLTDIPQAVKASLKETITV